MESPRRNLSRIGRQTQRGRVRHSPNNSLSTNCMIKPDQSIKSRIKSISSNNQNTKPQQQQPIRYSKKLPISFITAKDWRKYIHFTNDIISNGMKRPRTRVNRLLYSFLKLYHEYSYVCDNYLNSNKTVDGNDPNSSKYSNDNMMNSNYSLDDSEIESKCNRTKCPNNSVTFNDTVSWSNYNKFNDCLSNMSFDNDYNVVKQWFYNKFHRLKPRKTSVTKPYDKIRRYQQESIEIYSNEKSKTIIDHRISFTGFDSNGRPKIKWIQVPISLELLLPKIQIKIQRIMTACNFLYDPLEVAAELRYFNYSVDACIRHFHKTKKFRDIIEEFLPKQNQIKELEKSPQMLNKFKVFFEKITNDKSPINFNNGTLSVSSHSKRYNSTNMNFNLLNNEVDIGHMSLLKSKIVKIVCSVERIKLTKVEIRQMIIKTQNKYKKQMCEFTEIIIRTVESFKDFLMTEEQRGRVMHLLKQNDELKIKLKEEEKKRKTIYNMMQDQMGNVRVYCRCRALDKHQSVLDIKTNDTVAMQTGFCEEYKFDKVFEPFRTQAAIYSEFQPLILSFIDGFNVCFITYGGEASGKTYTLLGSTMTNPNSNGNDLDRHDGIMKRALKEVLTEQTSRRRDWDYNLSASVVEIYNDTFVDLLTGESNIHLPIDRGLDRVQESLKSVPLTCDSDIEALIKVCKLKRKIGRTALNPQSSRSHLVAMIHLTGRSKIHGETISSFLAMCDLAGFEDILKAETHNNQTLSKEAGYINKSLTAFNRVFTSLRRQDPNTVSYRDTKLTYLLKPFLTNQGKCALIVTVRTDKSSVSSTQSTLRFGRESRSVTLGKAKRQANLDKIIF